MTVRSFTYQCDEQKPGWAVWPVQKAWRLFLQCACEDPNRSVRHTNRESGDSFCAHPLIMPLINTALMVQHDTQLSEGVSSGEKAAEGVHSCGGMLGVCHKHTRAS